MSRCGLSGEIITSNVSTIKEIPQKLKVKSPPAQELEIINRGKILQLIGIGISKLPINCIKPLSLPHVEISDYIKSAITKAEYEANVKISDVFVSISENMTSEYIDFKIENENNLICEDHIKDFTQLWDKKNVKIIDDYAHHPTEIKVVLEGVNKVFKDYDKVCVFQPHRISRLKDLRKENARFWKDVMLEDINAIEGMQEGRNSPVYNGGNFSPVMDQPTHQFHKWVANSLL